MKFPQASKVTVKEQPQPEVITEVKTAIDSSTQEDSFVYVHCHFDSPGSGAMIRVWKTTFLIDASSGTRSELVHVENISIAPQWTMIPDGSTFSFLLIFSALPKGCLKFDLIEEIPQPRGFHVKDILRNETDVYHVTLA